MEEKVDLFEMYSKPLYAYFVTFKDVRGCENSLISRFRTKEEAQKVAEEVMWENKEILRYKIEKAFSVYFPMDMLPKETTIQIDKDVYRFWHYVKIDGQKVGARYCLVN